MYDSPPARALAPALFVSIVALLAPSAGAASFSARVRWLPSPSVVSGYHVRMRLAGGTYGAGIDAGTPAASADGTLSFVVGGLDVRHNYVFSVTAYDDQNLESVSSQELRLDYAQVAPYVDSDGDGLSDAAEDRNLNRLVDAGETNPNDPDSDHDGVGDANDSCQGTAPGATVNAVGCTCAQACDDGNPCNGVETCAAGTCRAGTPPSCDDGDPCTADTCSASAGCRHTALLGCNGCASSADCDDGNPCTIDICDAGHQCTFMASTFACDDDGNPCTRDVCADGACTHPSVPDGTSCAPGAGCDGASVCAAGACAEPVATAADTDLDLRVSRFILRSAGRRGIRMAARGWLPPSSHIAPDRDGFTIELSDAQGEVLYTATLPGDEIAVEDGGARFSYHAPSRDVQPYGGLHKLAIVPSADRTNLIVTAYLPPTLDGVLLSGATGFSDWTSLSWTIRTGRECGSEPMVCTGAKSKRCR